MDLQPDDRFIVRVCHLRPSLTQGSLLPHARWLDEHVGHAFRRLTDFMLPVEDLADTPMPGGLREADFHLYLGDLPIFSPEERISVLCLLDCGPVGLNRKIFP